jgi:hypothetical protein
MCRIESMTKDVFTSLLDNTNHPATPAVQYTQCNSLHRLYVQHQQYAISAQTQQNRTDQPGRQLHWEALLPCHKQAALAPHCACHSR